MISRLGARCTELDHPSLSSVNPGMRSPPAPPLRSLLFSSATENARNHVAMETTTAIQQNTSRTKKFISLICLRPPYLQVCLPRRLHLLACVTSCLSHYLPVCISVCPPASAPLLSDLKETLFSFQARKHLAGLPAWLLYTTIQHNTTYYPHGMFYIRCLSFLTPFFPSPQLCSQHAGRQEGWLRAAAPLPKPTASKDERPPLVAPPACCCQSRPLHIH